MGISNMKKTLKKEKENERTDSKYDSSFKHCNYSFPDDSNCSLEMGFKLSFNQLNGYESRLESIWFLKVLLTI